MPTFELLGTGVNGRADTLTLTAARKADAVAQAQKLGLTITDVRELGATGSKDHATRHLEALERIAASKLVRAPVWTICWGIILSSVIAGVFVAAVMLTLNLVDMLIAGQA